MGNAFIPRALMDGQSAMAKQKKGEGFHSAAGLIRYFDAEDVKALKVNPWLVVGIAVAISIIVLLLDVLSPT